MSPYPQQDQQEAYEEAETAMKNPRYLVIAPGTRPTIVRGARDHWHALHWYVISKMGVSSGTYFRSCWQPGARQLEATADGVTITVIDADDLQSLCPPPGHYVQPENGEGVQI